MPYDCIVIGAGISGLSAAHALLKQNRNVLVVEAQADVGGSMRSERTPDGFLLEHGPNTVTSNNPALWQHFDELGIAKQRVVAQRTGAKRYVLHDSELQPIPLSPPAFVRSGLLSPQAKLRLLAEPLMPRAVTPDESIAAFFTRRIGAAPFQQLVDPFVSGVYAGDPAQISMRAAFGRIWDAEQRAGSLLVGMITGRKRGSAPKTQRELFSFRERMDTWPRALAHQLGSDRLWCNTPAEALRPTNAGWQISVRRADESVTLDATTIVLATPANIAADLVATIDAPAAHVLHGIPYPSMSVIHLGYRRADVAHPLDGFGALCPAQAERQVLGTLWPSALFDGRAPAGHVLTTSFIGGTRYPHLAEQDDDGLVATAHAEQQFLIGARAAPVMQCVVRWPRAIPQYLAGHLDRISVLEVCEQRNQGLHFLGNYRDGVSVERCWQNGQALASLITAALVTRHTLVAA